MPFTVTRAIGILLLFCACAVAAPPAGYYSNAVGKTGQELRAALHAIIRGHRVIPYNSSSGVDTRQALRVLDEDPANTNNVLLVYAQRSEPKTNYPAVWNREHLWPNSYGLDDSGPAFSDLHNLRPEDENVNSARGNKYFERSDTNSISYRFPAHAEAPECSTDDDSWEPPPNARGDIARALFYMDLRYEGDAPGEPDLILTELLREIMSSTNLMGRLTTLLKWHLADPVSDAERLRNDLVFERYQQNRNPFVDHPEWVLSVFAPRLTMQMDAPANRIHFCWPAIYGESMALEFSSSPDFTTHRTRYGRVEGYPCLSFVMSDFALFYRTKFYRVVLP